METVPENIRYRWEATTELNLAETGSKDGKFIGVGCNDGLLCKC
jgi:hypothetical protein